HRRDGLMLEGTRRAGSPRTRTRRVAEVGVVGWEEAVAGGPEPGLRSTESGAERRGPGARRREVSLFDRQDILCLTANNAGSAVRSVKTAADIGCVRKSHKLGEQRRMSTIVGIDVHDVRFPTSRDLDGSDA